MIASNVAARAATVESFKKQWREAAVDERIDRNIEKYRKGDAVIRVVDAAGKPVANAEVSVRQIRHEFLFGSNAFVLGQLKTPEMNRRYEEAFARLFNFATIPFYWEGTEPTKGELRYREAGSRDIWRRPPPDRFLPWAAKYGIALKGHPLLWHAYNPPWLPKDADELRELYRKRFQEIARRYGGRISVFDVVNESQACPKSYPLYTPDKAYVTWAFNEAARLFPRTCTLMINDFAGFDGDPGTSPYFQQVKSLLAQGVQVRGIGFQSHKFRRAALDDYLDKKFNAAEHLDRYEKFGELGLPLFITEITIPSAGEDGERLQAEVVRAHYRLWFSAPKMAGITWWNLGDGTAVARENEAQGGLLDESLREKASYKALDQLINHDWTTSLTTTTDSRGEARFRGFYGEYQVAIAAAGRSQPFEIHLGRESSRLHRLTLAP